MSTCVVDSCPTPGDNRGSTSPSVSISGVPSHAVIERSFYVVHIVQPLSSHLVIGLPRLLFPLFIGGRIGQEGERRKSYLAAVIDGKERTDTIYVGDSIIRKTDTRLSKGEDVVVCLPGARIEHVTERVEKIVGRGNGGTILVHVGTNNTDKEGTTAIVDKYRKLLKKTKQARLGQIILSGILPVCVNRIQGYRNSKRMAVNGMVERLCKEEEVGYMDTWDSFVGNEELYFRDGLHLSGKGAAVLAEGLSGAVASGLGKVRYLN